MKILFKRYKFNFILLLVLSLTFITLSVIPTNYDLITPATLSNVGEVFDFYDGDEKINENDVNIYSVSVYEYYNVSCLTYIFAKMNKFSILEKHNNYVNTSYEYGISSGSIQKNVSLTNSLLAGYSKAGKSIDATFKGFIIHSIYGDGDKYFEIGDVITEVEGIEAKDETSLYPGNILLSLYGYVTEGIYSYTNLNLEDSYSFKVLRKGVEIEIDAKCFMYTYEDLSYPMLGISYYPYYVINSGSNPSYQIFSPDTTGPSAGLMQSLFVYETLSGDSLSKNIKVCGTGTVTIDGIAGEIGGIKAKIMAASANKADIFLCPSENYAEAKEQYDKLNTKMKLVEVTCLDDCINALREFGVDNE